MIQLEPVLKTFEGNEHAGKCDAAEEDVVAVFVAGHEPAERLQPRNRPLHTPETSQPMGASSVRRRRPTAVGSVLAHQFDLLQLQSFAQGSLSAALS